VVAVVAVVAVAVVAVVAVAVARDAVAAQADGATAVLRPVRRRKPQPRRKAGRVWECSTSPPVRCP
jgi:hypothetical protein